MDVNSFSQRGGRRRQQSGIYNAFQQLGFNGPGRSSVSSLGIVGDVPLREVCDVANIDAGMWEPPCLDE